MKYALVTGGSRGLGRAICVKLSQMGIPVLINYQSNQQAAEEVRDMIASAGGNASLIKFDVSDKDEVSAALQYCKGRVELYDCKIKEYVASGISVEEEPVAMALKLIGEVGCGMPDQLFLALHTVSEHLK